MAPWNGGFKASKHDPSVPADSSRETTAEEALEEESPRSPICIKFNQLSLRQTGYVEESELREALDDIFKNHGKLKFGLTVSSVKR